MPTDDDDAGQQVPDGTNGASNSSRNERERVDNQHQIHQSDKISVRINYRLDSSSQILVFDSIEDESGMLDFQQGERLEHQVEKHDLHCTCGKAVNMTSEQEAVRHLDNLQSIDDSGSPDQDDDSEQQEPDGTNGIPNTCPECGGENIESVPDQPEEFVCSDCGLVLDSQTDSTMEGAVSESIKYNENNEISGSSSNTTQDSNGPEWREYGDREDEGEQLQSPEWRGSDDKQVEEPEEYDKRFHAPAFEPADEPAPETVDEWRMWYPCPECQSTNLNQITEQHLSVSATEDGSYGGDAGGMEEYNFIECMDCGEVLLDEIGKS